MSMEVTSAESLLSSIFTHVTSSGASHAAHVIVRQVRADQVAYKKKN